MKTALSIQVSGMNCERCVGAIEESLSALAGVEGCHVEVGVAEVRWDDSVTCKAEILAAIRGAGSFDIISFSVLES